MRRILGAVYGASAYLAFLLPIGYLVGFMADVGVPKTVDHGAGPLGPSLSVDILLLLAFAVQHSIMARPAFKRRLQRWVPGGLERSTYVLASGLVLATLFWLWRPIPLVLWDVSGTALGSLAWTGFAVGWMLAVWATFALSHFHLFGMTQAAAYVRDRPPPRLALRQTLLYRLVRHPMTAGLLLAFWSAPRMTLGHAVFAAGMTVYSLVATVLEERDLLRDHPDRYRAYRESVPALVPLLRPGWAPGGTAGFVMELVLVAAAATLPLRSVFGLSLAPPALAATVPAVHRDSLVVGGRGRSYTLFDPYDGSGRGVGRAVASSTPDSRTLVIALHGTGGDAARFRGFLGGELERAAAARGWLVAFPEAFGRIWNDCRRVAGARPRAFGVDDVAFVRALIRRLARERHVDPSRVFALGYSGGGHMAFRLALEGAGLVRGVAAFGASVPTDAQLVCATDGPLAPVLMVNGTADPINPWAGGDVIGPTGVPLGPVRSAEESLDYLRSRAGGRVDVRLVPVEGGGHTVPGQASRFPSVAGRTVRSLSGVDVALDFFETQLRADPEIS